MIKTTVMLREEQHEVIKKKSYDEGISLGYIIRECIDALIMDKTPEKKPQKDDVAEYGQKLDEYYPQPKKGSSRSSRGKK